MSSKFISGCFGLVAILGASGCANHTPREVYIGSFGNVVRHPNIAPRQSYVFIVEQDYRAQRPFSEPYYIDNVYRHSPQMRNLDNASAGSQTQYPNASSQIEAPSSAMEPTDQNSVNNPSRQQIQNGGRSPDSQQTSASFSNGANQSASKNNNCEKEEVVCVGETRPYKKDPNMRVILPGFPD